MLARVPAPGDNAAIATRRLEAGARVAVAGRQVTLAHTVLEGHRFATEPIPAGAALRSWGLPFGYALREIAPGEYLRNARVLDALRVRGVDIALPEEPNFRDTDLAPYVLDEARFVAAPPVAPAPPEARRTFLGYDRGARRGVGTRNDIVILGTTSRTAAWARALAARLSGLAEGAANVDGIVAVGHTEGGAGTPNNLHLLLRTLAGFVVHPNVGAVLIVDRGDEAVSNDLLRRYLREHGYPLDEAPHRFVTLRDSFERDMQRGEELVRGWLPAVAARRSPQPLSALKLGLQCGGSDAFSGISGNPLAAWAAHELVRQGGAANLAETDELIGAEEYILANVADIDTARRFLATIERFKERVAWHGHTAEGNPSGGNLYRGLYNIALKSIGAAMKKDPRTRLDAVIEYGERMTRPGYYFMDSPGNDLESIAGQVASGCNLLLFVTGNGSVTNFPFVPTIKIVTTTERYRLLAKDMDINAGAYLDGTPMDALGAELVERMVAVASGERSVGELAGHAQVSIWRDWQQTGPADISRLVSLSRPSREPLLRRAAVAPDDLPPADRSLLATTYRAVATTDGPRSDRVGLILPTSLCSGQIALRIAARLSARLPANGAHPVSRYVALAHTEGCGVSSGVSEELYVRTLLGYLLHPSVGPALLLEHGCEKTHNDYFRHQLRRRRIDPERFGWASIQRSGGIEAVTMVVEGWFAAAEQQLPPLEVHDASLADLRLGIAAVGEPAAEVRRALARVARVVVAAGGLVVTPESAPLAAGADEWRAWLGVDAAHPSLAYGDSAPEPGLYLMETPTTHWAETLAGLGATGVDVVLVAVPRPVEAHPLVPVAQVVPGPAPHPDADLMLNGDPDSWPAALLALAARVAGREHRPWLQARGATEFQITRGRLGVSM